MILAVLLAAQVVGVLEFRDKVPAEQRIDAAYLSDQVRTAVKELLPQAKVITRENMLVLLQSSGKKLEECEGECEVDTGRRIGADLVVSGELLRFGTQYKLNMKLHDTRTGELVAGSVASGATADELDRALRPAVEKLLAPLRSAAAQDALSDQRQAAKEAPAQPAGPSLFAFAAHAGLGYGLLQGSEQLLPVPPDTITTSTSSGGIDLSVAIELGVHLGPVFTLAAFGGYDGVAADPFTHLLTYGIAGRARVAEKLSLVGGVGFSRFTDAVSGPAFKGAVEYAISGPIWLHAQVVYAHQSNSDGLFAGAASALAISGGISLIY